MKRDLLGSTALGVVSEFQARAKERASTHKSLPKNPIRIPSSLALMSRLLEEIFKVKAGLDIRVETAQQDNSIVVSFNQRDPKTASLEKDYMISEILKGLAGTEAGEELEFLPNTRLVVAPDKLALYDFLNELVLEAEGLVTPDTYTMKDLQGPELQDYKNELLLECLELEKKPVDFKNAFVSMASRPYVDIAEYRANLYLTSTTSLSIPLGHIYRCLQQEEGMELPGKSGMTLGGYN